jgi:hypothetical protein
VRPAASKIERARAPNLRLFFLFVDHFADFFGDTLVIGAGFGLRDRLVVSLVNGFFGPFEKAVSGAGCDGERI